MTRPFLHRWVSWFKEAGIHAMDVVIAGYSFFLGGLILLFHSRLRGWPIYVAVHWTFPLGLYAWIRLATRTRYPLLYFIRTFYPLLFVLFAWKEMDALVTLLFPYWANEWVIRADLWLFGTHPTVWVQRLFRPWLTELMNFFYASFWLFIPLGALPLYFQKRERETLDFLFFAVFTYAVSYLLFLFFPAEGAWVTLKEKHTVEATGGIFQHLNQWVQSKGTIRGGAFPSSHVAAAVSMTWAAFYQKRKVGFLFLFLSIGVALSTVYCRYHHAVDALAGIFSGTFLFFLGRRLLFGKRHRQERDQA